MESNSTNQISIENLWKIFRKNWILIVLLSLVAAIGIGVAYSFLYTPIYSSGSQYYVSNISGNDDHYSNGQTSAAEDMAQCCAEFLNGSVVLNQILQNAGLTEVLTVSELHSMIETSVTTAIIKVTVSANDANLCYRISRSIESVFPNYCDIFNNQNSAAEGTTENGSYMLKVTDMSVLDTEADNKSNLIKFPLLAFLLVFILSYAYFFVFYLFDTIIYNRDDLKEKLPEYPLFGAIPYWDISKSPTTEGKRRENRKKKKSKEFLHSFSKERIISKEDTPMYILEAFRQLSTNVTFCSSGEKGCTIGMISPHVASGKSFIMANLAISLSQNIDKKILLVDADMRLPMIHQIFGLENKIGFSNLLTGKLSNSSENQAQVYHTIGNGSLTVLTSGEIPPNPVKLLSSPKTKALIEAWEKEYDFILFDLPPIGVMADAVSISRYISGFLFVLRSGISDIHRVRDAIELLKDHDAKIHGFVLTDVDEKIDPYYSHYGYGEKGKKEN